METATKRQSQLKESWIKLVKVDPTLRIRDAAAKLNVTEAELLATGISENVLRLNNNFKDLLCELHSLGRVMALTRNNEIVHERKGVYKNAQTDLPHKMALFVNPDIDLRIFLKNWHYAFAATVENPRGTLSSLQIFDIDGTAVHKIYLTDQSNVDAYQRLIEKFKSEDQTTTIKIRSKTEKKPDKPDSEINIKGLRKAWSELKDTHDFFPLLKDFDVGRKQALRLTEDRFAREVPADSYKLLLEEARDRQVPIMVFVGNDGIIQIHSGEVKNVLETDGWFNVMDKDFNLHIDQTQIGSAFIVRKPTADGVVTSLELFNRSDKDIALFFGKRKPGIPEREDWRKLIADLEAKFA